VGWTLGDALRRVALRGDGPLVGLLSMLVEDTVHSSVDAAPLINAALGITIRGAGLARARGGMWGFWRAFVARFRALGGTLRVGTRALAISGRKGAFTVATSRGPIAAAQVVSSVPRELTCRLAIPEVTEALRPSLLRDREARGGALVVFLGVPEGEVESQAFTHHQLLLDWDAPLGNGNNMFISVSSPGDTQSAPAGHRAVMISTHCELAPWRDLEGDAYLQAKAAAGERLVHLARRVFPYLGSGAVVREVATPRTYARYTARPEGAVGGVRQNLGNTNQRAVAHDLGIPGFWLAGDDTWPGLGTVACCLGSRIVADLVSRAASPAPDGAPRVTVTPAAASR
jgi:phytoene dehydrogenase-like protein